MRPNAEFEIGDTVETNALWPDEKKQGEVLSHAFKYRYYHYEVKWGDGSTSMIHSSWLMPREEK